MTTSLLNTTNICINMTGFKSCFGDLESNMNVLSVLCNVQNNCHAHSNSCLNFDMAG